MMDMGRGGTILRIQKCLCRIVYLYSVFPGLKFCNGHWRGHEWAGRGPPLPIRTGVLDQSYEMRKIYESFGGGNTIDIGLLSCIIAFGHPIINNNVSK